MNGAVPGVLMMRGHDPLCDLQINSLNIVGARAECQGIGGVLDRLIHGGIDFHEDGRTPPGFRLQASGFRLQASGVGPRKDEGGYRLPSSRLVVQAQTQDPSSEELEHI